MFKIIVAMTNKRGIGYANKLPWSYKKDLKYFKRKTIGKGNNCVIMGKNTWDSIDSDINEPLPKRDKIIMTSSNKLDIRQSNCEVANNIDDVLNICKKNKYDENWVIGGENVYSYFLKNNLVTDVFITEIQNQYICDTFFPPLSNDFKLAYRTESIYENKKGIRFTCWRKSENALNGYVFYSL